MVAGSTFFLCLNGIVNTFRQSAVKEFDLDFNYIWKIALFDSLILRSLSTLAITVWICNKQLDVAL